MKDTQENYLGKEVSQATRIKSVRILIVKDKLQDMPSFLRCLCRLPGYIVASKQVVNLPQALYQLHNEHFDIIFLDEGFNSDATAKEVLETFRECKIDVPVVIITAEDNKPAIAPLLNAGAYGFISSCDLETRSFAETIQKALRRSAVSDEQKD